MVRLVLIAFLALYFATAVALGEDAPGETHAYVDVCIAMTGNNAQVRAAIRVLGLEQEMIQYQLRQLRPLHLA